MVTPINTNRYREIEQINYHEGNTKKIIEFVTNLLDDAVNRHASDIHLEPQQHKMRVRFRIDGVLHLICEPHYATTAAIMSHLKVCANLDIAEKRLPQDGRLEIHLSQYALNARISVLPTLFGEKIVLRLLYKNKNCLNIEKLGLQNHQKIALLNAISKPQGLILITGPTGSGKTTTLYTLLERLNTIEKNITCIEEPVEIELPGTNQLSINHKIGMDFQNGLRALLRQDPDIIVIGEIRDAETAKMAIQAAQTGHLVFSTLHTNSAIESLSRMKLLGISNIEIEESVILIVAQRLLRKLCKLCNKKPIVNCPKCLNGYSGQTGIYEYIEKNQLKEKNRLKIKIQYLKDCAQIKVKSGITSVDEVKRVLG